MCVSSTFPCCRLQMHIGHGDNHGLLLRSECHLHVVVVNSKSQFLLEENKYTTCFCHESDFKNNSVVSMTDQKKLDRQRNKLTSYILTKNALTLSQL